MSISFILDLFKKTHTNKSFHRHFIHTQLGKPFIGAEINALVKTLNYLVQIVFKI